MVLVQRGRAFGKPRRGSKAEGGMAGGGGGVLLFRPEIKAESSQATNKTPAGVIVGTCLFGGGGPTAHTLVINTIDTKFVFVYIKMENITTGASTVWPARGPP